MLPVLKLTLTAENEEASRLNMAPIQIHNKFDLMELRPLCSFLCGLYFHILTESSKKKFTLQRLLGCVKS